MSAPAKNLAGVEAAIDHFITARLRAGTGTGTHEQADDAAVSLVVLVGLETERDAADPDVRRRARAVAHGYVEGWHDARQGRVSP